MALKATVYKASLAIADMDRSYYESHDLTIACHPSETEKRLMLRLLAFALFASNKLGFTRGISSEDEPDLWEKDLTDHITHWIELGCPDESRIRKGCNRSDKVTVIAYGERSARIWWEKIHNKLSRHKNLSVLFVDDDRVEELASLVQRNMELQVSIQDGHIWIGRDEKTMELSPQIWM
jgi:uncharacterized protein YaeQ